MLLILKETGGFSGYIVSSQRHHHHGKSSHPKKKGFPGWAIAIIIIGAVSVYFPMPKPQPQF